MGDFLIRPLADGEPAPIDLLLQADPSLERVRTYLSSGRGYGKRLVQHAAAVACSLGYRLLQVRKVNSSIHQLAFYQKCGFRIVGVDLDFFTRNYPEPIFENGIQCRDMIRMVRHLHDSAPGT